MSSLILNNSSSACHTMSLHAVDIWPSSTTSTVKSNSRLMMAASKLRHHKKMKDSNQSSSQHTPQYIGRKSYNNNLLMCIGENCTSTDLTPIEGYITCRTCGICQSPVIDSQDEKRYHEEQPGGSANVSHRANSATVGNTTISEIVPTTILSTTIGNGHGNGKRGDAKYIRTLRKEAKHRQFSSKDSAILKKLGNISNICKSAGINKRTIEEIQWTFHKLSNIQTTKRRKHQALMATATIIGCRECGVEKDMNEIATKYDLDIRVLRRMVKQYEMLWEEIKEKEEQLEKEETTQSIIDYQEELDNYHIVRIKPEGNIDGSNNTNGSDDANNITIIVNNGSDNGDGTDNIDNDSDDNKNNIDGQSANVVDPIQESLNKDDNMKLLKYLRKLPIPESYHGIIFNINDWINTNNTLAQHIPISRYASVIYLSSRLFKLNISKGQIVAVCGISEVTIKKCYAKLGNIEESMQKILS